MQISNVAVKKLVEEFNTPLFVYDQNQIEEIVNEYLTNFKSNLFETEIVYASKALDIEYMYKLINDLGLSLDVVSGGELYGAKKVSFNMKNVYFHGNNKSIEELEMAFNYNVGTIVLDNIDEVKTIIELSNKLKKEINVLLRINVGVSAHTHEYIITSHPDSKFGVFIEDNSISNIVELLNSCSYTNFKGFHSHIGSQIFDMTGFEIAIDKLFDLLKNYNAEVLNIGGGFGIKYIDSDQPIKIKDVCDILIKKLESKIKETNINLKKVCIEPGRSIVGESGYTLYTIGNQKITKNKKYYFVDGGMSDNIRPALYQAQYKCDIANRLNEEKTEKVCIAGRNCESGDIIITDIMLPKAEKNDILVVYSTGAYCYSMSSNYNQALKLPIVFVKDGKAKLVSRRETYEDLYKLSVK